MQFEKLYGQQLHRQKEQIEWLMQQIGERVTEEDQVDEAEAVGVTQQSEASLQQDQDQKPLSKSLRTKRDSRPIPSKKVQANADQSKRIDDLIMH